MLRAQFMRKKKVLSQLQTVLLNALRQRTDGPRCSHVNAKSCELTKKVGGTKDPAMVNSVCVNQPLQSLRCCRVYRNQTKNVILYKSSTFLGLSGLDRGRNIWGNFSGGRQFPGSWSEQASQSAEHSKDREGKCGSHYWGALLQEQPNSLNECVWHMIQLWEFWQPYSFPRMHKERNRFGTHFTNI